MIPDLPTHLLRTFVAVAESGSLSAATARVGRSESALSLQMSRLEDLVGASLFERDGRALKTNVAGANFLTQARSILAKIDAVRFELDHSSVPARIGIVQDFTETILQPTLEEVRDTTFAGSISVLVDSTSEILNAMSEERLDVALCASDFGFGGYTRNLFMRWFGNPHLFDAEVIPLVGVTAPCPFMKAAQRSLDMAGKPWRMVMTTPSLDGVRAAVGAGLGITCRTAAGMRTTPATQHGLPDLPEISYAVIQRRSAQGAVTRVAEVLSRQLRELVE